MNFQRGKKSDELEINFIPLIDVLLVIIIFLIVSATFSRVNELQINLPTSETATQQEDKPLVISVGVFANGRYVINGRDLEDISTDGISLALKKAVGDGKEPTIVIEADAEATHQSVIKVLDASRKAGYPNITFPAQESSGF
ncbi:MAG: biopolymer transporter ExbD [Methylophilaceae bacterium]|jgi:biopolymer transport protein ExbD|nr:biopolymer transporter ExbD [Methylophilaceae bacterium]